MIAQIAEIPEDGMLTSVQVAEIKHVGITEHSVEIHFSDGSVIRAQARDFLGGLLRITIDTEGEVSRA